MLGAAGGHKDYGGNEVNAIRLEAETPAWIEAEPASPNSEITANDAEGVQYYNDGKPSAGHTYWATQFITSLDRMVIFCTGGYNGPGGNWPSTLSLPANDVLSWSYHWTAQEWDSRSYIAQFPDDGDQTGCLCVKHPTTEEVYYSRNNQPGVYKWTPGSNSWSLVSTHQTYWYCGAAIDPNRDRALCVGSNNGSVAPRIFDLATGYPVSATFSGLGASALTVGGYPSVVYDSENDCFWVLHLTYDGGGAPNGSRLLKVTAGGLVVSEPTTTGTPPIGRGGTGGGGFCNSLQYVPNLKGIVVADSYTGNVKFMRTA